MMPHKVFYLITSLELGGAQTVLINLLRHLDRTLFAPTVICLYGSDTPAAAAISAADVPIIDLQMTRKWRVDAFWRLYQLLHREKPSILHNILFHAVVPGRILGRLAGVPIILSWRQNVELGSKWRDRFNRWTISLDDHVVAVSEAAQQAEIHRSGINPGQIALIPNSVDLANIQQQVTQTDRHLVRQTLGLPTNALVIGSIGRLHPQKGLAFLLEAMLFVCEAVPKVCLLVMGDGDLRQQLSDQTKSLGLQEVVLFARARDNVPQVLAAIDLFVLPSLWEGLPLVVLEAMAAGLPVVATAVGGTPELVVEGETGLLVPPRDPAALAQAILALLNDPELAQRLGENGRLRVATQFTIQQMVQQTENLYQQLIGTHNH